MARMSSGGTFQAPDAVNICVSVGAKERQIKGVGRVSSDIRFKRSVLQRRWRPRLRSRFSPRVKQVRSTSRARPGETVGYTDLQLSPNRYRVTFSGNSATRREDVENYLLRRAAEVTLAAGYTHFAFDQRDTEARTYYREDFIDPYFGDPFYGPRAWYWSSWPSYGYPYGAFGPYGYGRTDTDPGMATAAGDELFRICGDRHAEHRADSRQPRRARRPVSSPAPGAARRPETASSSQPRRS